MPELDPVRQDIEANAAEYLAVMDEMIAKAEAFANAVRDDETALLDFGATANAVASALGRATGAAKELQDALGGVSRASASMASMERNVADASADLMMQTSLLASMDERLAGIQRDVADSSADLMMQTQMMRAGYTALDSQIAATIGMLGALAGAQRGAAAATDRGGQAAQRTFGVWGLTANAIHWIIMGTLEIAATAIPALVAFGAAAAAMAPTFIHIKDVMSALVISTGSYSGALAASVPQLQAMGRAGAALKQAVAPDAYIIFGSAIQAVTSHVGAFAGIAQQASNVLAQFSTKIVTDLNGPAGAALAGFFSNAVKYMIQWGQFLGNLGHTFLNVMHSMWGVAQVLLDVFVELSRVLLAVSSNPVGSFLIGLAAAMSAVYRWGKLLVTIWTWLGGSAAVTAISSLVGLFVELAGEVGVVNALLAMTDALVTTASASIAGAGVAALELWALNSNYASDATQKFINHLESLPPTAATLTSNIGQMEKGLQAASQAQTTARTTSHQLSETWKGMAIQTLVAGHAAMDVGKYINAIGTEGRQLISLSIGMAQLGMRTGQVGGAMAAMQIQTSLADGKVQQMSQAIDQYIALVTGGTGGVANFVTAMSNIGSVAATQTNNLGTSTVQLSLSAKQFSEALSTMNTKGAAAWQNLNQVITGSMAPLGDWMRQAQAMGAVTGPQFSRAMLDMAHSVIPFIGNNKTAQAELLGFLRAQGLSFPSFGKLKDAAMGTGHGIKDLTGIMDAATQKMADLSQMAKNVASAMNNQVTGALATAALNSTHFNKDLTQLQTDMSNRAPANVIHGDLGRINGDLQLAQQRGVNAGNGIAAGMNHGASATGAAAAAIKHSLDLAHQAAINLQNFLNSMHGKNIYVNTVFSVSGQQTAPGTGGKYAAYPGASGGYVTGPGTKTSDSIPARLSHGEYVMQASAVDHYGRGVLDAMNARKFAGGGPVGIRPGPSPSLLAAAGGGGGAMTLNQNQRFEVKLDGSVVGSTQRTQVLTYARRNPSSNWDLRVR